MILLMLFYSFCLLLWLLQFMALGFFTLGIVDVLLIIFCAIALLIFLLYFFIVRHIRRQRAIKKLGQGLYPILINYLASHHETAFMYDYFLMEFESLLCSEKK